MLEDLKRIIDYGIEELRKGGPAFVDFQNVVKKYFSLDACYTCPGGFQSAFDLVSKSYINKLNSKTMTTPDSKFAFKNDGITIYSPHLHQSFSNKNLTDQAALVILKENQEYAKHFAKIPADWKKQVTSFEMPKSFAEVQAEKKAAAEKEQKKAGKAETNATAPSNAPVEPEKKAGKKKAAKAE